MENVRGRDVFIVQPTSPPANDHLMELLVMVDACRRASAARVTAVVPYFGYARQDRRLRDALGDHRQAGRGHDRHCRRQPVVDAGSAHRNEIQGFFGIPVDNVYGSPVLLGDIFGGSAIRT